MSLPAFEIKIKGGVRNIETNSNDKGNKVNKDDEITGG